MRILEFSNQANLDLEDIYGFIYLESQAPHIAQNLTDKIIKECDRLCAHPKLGYKIDKSETRVLASKSYMVFYTVSKNVVLVTRILHGAQNWSAIIKHKD